MQGYFSLVLHAHLPFVRHPEHERFLEENWLFEAIIETYIPLLQVLERWGTDRVDARLALTLSPTLCSMLRDPLLQDRASRHLESLIELSERELHRTTWEPSLGLLARMYHERFRAARETWLAHGRDLVTGFGRFQDEGILEIITCAATHGLLPLMAGRPQCIRAQILAARDHYRQCFGRDPRGIWLPECAYTHGVEVSLKEAGIGWFITDTHGVLNAQPRPRYGVFAALRLPNGVAALGRDLESARQVWSRQEGYPGDVVYRDFYRDIGYDLDHEYVQSCLPGPGLRGFTGIKYHCITGQGAHKTVYNRAAALERAEAHAAHFLDARAGQFGKLSAIMDRPPLILSAYDAELFGHWWYEGPEFLDAVVRGARGKQDFFKLATPSGYLADHPGQQIGTPSPSSWGEEGYWKLWLNESNAWIRPHLEAAEERMVQLATRFPGAAGLKRRALNQAGRELLLAQASDWPFILRTGTSPEYATRRVKDHLGRFLALFEPLDKGGAVDEAVLARIEAADNIFPELNYEYWA
jgi:1,4-alpha-glucan branching enzyme